MNKNTVIDVCDRYIEDIKNRDLIAKGLFFLGDRTSTIERINMMLPKIKEFIEEGGVDKREKAMRWLGFVQGCLWCIKTYNIEEMSEHNRGWGK